MNDEFRHIEHAINIGRRCVRRVELTNILWYYTNALRLLSSGMCCCYCYPVSIFIKIDSKNYLLDLSGSANKINKKNINDLPNVVIGCKSNLHGRCF